MKRRTNSYWIVSELTFTFRAFSRHFNPKQLTISTFVIIYIYLYSKDSASASTDNRQTYSLYTAVILTTDATQMTILLKLYKIQHTLGAYVPGCITYNGGWRGMVIKSLGEL